MPRKKDGPGIRKVFWDPLEPTSDGTIFTTRVRVELWGKWQKWETLRFSDVTIELTDVAPGSTPLTEVSQLEDGELVCGIALAAGHHYKLRVTVDGVMITEVIAVPETPKPKPQETEELATQKILLEIDEVENQRTDTTLKTQELKKRIAELANPRVERKLPEKLEVDVVIVTWRKKYKLLIHVFGKEGIPLADAKGKFINGSVIDDFTTDADGTKTIEVSFDGPSRYVEVQVGAGNNLQWGTMLPGTQPSP